MVDINTQEILGPNKTGEILFKGNNLTTGYYNNPEDTANMLTDDGYLRTGDFGFYDEDECFYIVDRVKDLIKFQIWNVI